MANPDAETPLLRVRLPGYGSIVAGLIERAPGVAYLELARPLRHNSFHEELWSEFPRALRELDALAETRVIVIAGQGKNFCAGIDVGYLMRNLMTLTTPATTSPPISSSGASGPEACPGAQRALMRRNILGLQDAYSEIERCRSPVLAAVHGRCIGGGVDLVTACDIRLCSEDASFCVKEVDLAIAADLGTLQRLPHIIGHGAAMDLALTARTVAAAEAQRLGLVSAVVASVARGGAVSPYAAEVAGPGATPSTAAADSAEGDGSGRRAVVAAALRLASTIAAKPQLAVQGTKRVLLHARDNPRVSDGLDYVATWNSAQLLSVDLAMMLSGSRRGGGGGGGGGGGTVPKSRL